MTVAASTLAPAFAAMLGDLRGREVAVIGHARPDGDCIGAQVGLARVLRSAGFAVVCVNPDPVPRRLRFLVGDPPFHTSDTVPGDPLAVYVDCADHLRAGEKARRRFPEPVGNIDHHLSNTSFARHNIVDTRASAACEMIAGLALGAGLTVDAAAAQALFVGIQTDTGQFRFASTTRETFLLAAELVARGARPAEAGFELYERESPGKLQLLQRFLASLEFACGGRVCIGTLPLGIYGETGTTAEDTEGLVDYARSIDGVDIGVLIEERPDGVKASLRAKEPALRLDQVAAGFNGGGHACAAGLNLKGAAAQGFRARLILALETQLATAGRPISRNA
jgi:bifunctional oligoribonuclease and PAP phosphatase NrnA